MGFLDLRNEIPFEIPIQQILLGEGVAGAAEELCAGLGKLHLVADANTVGLVQIDCSRTVLPAGQKALLATAQKLAQAECDCFVAVGSGTVNDLVKYAAHLAGKPYVVFATAASMNGYASANASLIPAGELKQSFVATAPRAIYIDTQILADAPPRLRIAGIGDSICRATVEADCLLAHKLTGAPSYAEYFALMKRHEAEMVDSIEALARTLIFSGVAMLLAGSSAPASGGEHMLAHYMELNDAGAVGNFHGEDIAVTTVAMAALQLRALEQGLVAEEDFAEIMAGHAQIEARLLAIGAPTKPSDLGWDEDIFVRALVEAKHTRDRKTFLDLV